MLHQDVLEVGDGGEVLLADDLGGEEGEGHDEEEHAEAAQGDGEQEAQLLPRAARALDRRRGPSGVLAVHSQRIGG